jgi:WD40 repeat protein
MIIVHDLLTDQKINLVHHSNEIVALAFSPPGVGSAPSTTGAGGEFLISIDLNRNEMSELNNHSHSKMCLWSWQKGLVIQEIQIPRSQNYTSLLLQPNLAPN